MADRPQEVAFETRFQRQSTDHRLLITDHGSPNLPTNGFRHFLCADGARVVPVWFQVVGD